MSLLQVVVHRNFVGQNTYHFIGFVLDMLNPIVWFSKSHFLLVIFLFCVGDLPQEWVEGSFRGNLGEVFIRCNNVLWLGWKQFGCVQNWGERPPSSLLASEGESAWFHSMFHVCFHWHSTYNDRPKRPNHHFWDIPPKIWLISDSSQMGTRKIRIW